MKFVIGMAFAVGASLCGLGVAFAQDNSGGPSGPDARSQSTTDTPAGAEVTPSTPPTTTIPVIEETTVVRDTYVTENRTYWSRPIGAPRKAFELGLNTGYTQGFGDLGARRNVKDIAGPGLGFGLNLGYRASPGVSIGLGGTYQELSPVSDVTTAKARGVTAGLDVTLHLTPYDRVDIWGSLGTGYRMLWNVGGKEESTGSVTRRVDAEQTNVLRHGFQLAKIQLGFDVRVSRNVGIGPVIGADINTMLWRDENRGAGSVMMDTRGLSTFLFGGIQGRFDIGGERVDEWTAQMARR